MGTHISLEGVAGEGEVENATTLEIPITQEVLQGNGSEMCHLIIPVAVKVDQYINYLTADFSIGDFTASDDAEIQPLYGVPNELVFSGTKPFQTGMYGYTDTWAWRSFDLPIDNSSSMACFIYKVYNDMPVGTTLTLTISNPYTVIYFAARAHIVRGLQCHPVGNRHSQILSLTTPSNLRIPFHDVLDAPGTNYRIGDLIVYGQQHQHYGWVGGWDEPNIPVPVLYENGAWTNAGVTWTHVLAPNYNHSQFGAAAAFEIPGDHTATYVKGRKLKYGVPSGPTPTRYAQVRGSELVSGNTYVYVNPLISGYLPRGTAATSPQYSDDPAPPDWPRYWLEQYSFDNSKGPGPLKETRHWGYGFALFDEDDYIRDYAYPFNAGYVPTPYTGYFEYGAMGHWWATYPSGLGEGCPVPSTEVTKERILAYRKEGEWWMVPETDKPEPHEMVRFELGAWEQAWENDIVVQKDDDWHQPLE